MKVIITSGGSDFHLNSNIYSQLNCPLAIQVNSKYVCRIQSSTTVVGLQLPMDIRRKLDLAFGDSVDVQAIQHIPTLEKLDLKLMYGYKSIDDLQILDAFQSMAKQSNTIWNLGITIWCHNGKAYNVNIDCKPEYGVLRDETILCIAQPATCKSIDIKTFSIDKLNVGGLSTQFETLFQQLFMSRLLPESELQKTGMDHVRGVILHGPPGCGKTRLARGLSSILNVPKERVSVINGPELLSKYIGEAENNVRDIFKPAKDNPDELHIIIFDEFDSLARSRGSSENHHGDKVVNQLLTMIDGINKLNNIIVFGLTNRLDLLDQALLRPGRFETHLYVGLPDAKGRSEIINIHAQSMIKHKIFDQQYTQWLVEHTENFTGAELEACIRNAVLHAYREKINPDNIQQCIDKLSKTGICLTIEHLQYAVDSIQPMFVRGFNYNFIRETYPSDIWTSSSEVHIKIANLINTNSNVCLYGPRKCKTVVACMLLEQSSAKYKRYLRGKDFIGKTNAGKLDLLKDIYTTDVKQGLIVLDNLEIILEYTFNSYNNQVLQGLKVYLNERQHTTVIICRNMDCLTTLSLNDEIDNYISVE